MIFDDHVLVIKLCHRYKGVIQLVNDFSKQLLFVFSFSKRVQGSAIKTKHNINTVLPIRLEYAATSEINARVFEHIMERFIVSKHRKLRQSVECAQ